MFRVLYLYISGVSTSLFRVIYLYTPGSLPSHTRFRILNIFFEFFIFIFWVLYQYILGSLLIYSGFSTHIFLVLYLYIPGSQLLYSGFSTSLFRFYLPLYSGFSILGLFQTPHPGAELQAGFSINPASQSPSISVSQSAGFSAYKITNCTDYIRLKRFSNF